MKDLSMEMATYPQAMNVKDPFDDSCEELDPRIKNELETLNQAASDVNRLEKEINEARHKYQETFYECSQELEVLRKKYGSKVNKARAYYETKELAKEAQSVALLSARKFQSANGVYLAAKETISLAEFRLKDDKAASLSPAWQEMLNHALIRVMESEQEKTKSEKEHLERAAVFSEMEKKLHVLEKKHKNSINKAKPYFDAKNELELKLQQIKQTMEDLHQAVLSAKTKYAMSLKNLEAISDGIHEARRQKIILMYPREPGVGAEDAQETELPSLPCQKSDFDMSANADDQSYSGSEEEDDYDGTCGENENKIRDDNNVMNSQTNSCLSCGKDNTSNVEKAFRMVSVKDHKKLRKCMSMPSYVVEESLNVQSQTIEIKTDNIILKMESGVTIAKESNSWDVQNVAESDIESVTESTANSSTESTKDRFSESVTEYVTENITS